MIRRSKLALGLNILFICIGLLVLVNIFEWVEFTVLFLKTFVYWTFLALIPLVLFLNFKVLKVKKWSAITLLISLIVLISLSNSIIKQGVFGYLMSFKPWETQTVLYENQHFGFKKIEFQRKDIGILGFSERTVKIYHLNRWFVMTEEIDTNTCFMGPWRKVDVIKSQNYSLE